MDRHCRTLGRMTYLIHVPIYPSRVKPLLPFPIRYEIYVLYGWIVASFAVRGPHIDPYKAFAVMRMRYTYCDKLVGMIHFMNWTDECVRFNRDCRKGPQRICKAQRRRRPIASQSYCAPPAARSIPIASPWARTSGHSPLQSRRPAAWRWGQNSCMTTMATMMLIMTAIVVVMM